MDNDTNSPAPQPGAVFGAGENPTRPENNNDGPLVAKAPDTPPKKSKKKLLLVLLLLLLIAGAAAAYWYFEVREKSENPVATQPAPVNETPKKYAETLFAQAGSKMYHFDTKTKKTTQISQTLPENAIIIDYYTDGDTWRLYYSVYKDKKNAEGVTTESINEYYLLEENSAEPKLVYASDQNYAVASAKARVLAYQQILMTDFSQKTYVVEGTDKPELAYQGKPDAPIVPATAKLFALDDISEDGNKLLYGLRTCFQCDGPALSTAFEYNLDIKKPTSVLHKAGVQGNFGYLPDGKILYYQNINVPNLGDIIGNFQLSVFTIDTKAARTQTVLTVNDSDMSGLALNNDLQIASVSKRIGQPGMMEDVFDGFYLNPGKPDFAAWQKLQVKGLNLEDPSMNRHSRLESDCFLVAYQESKTPNAGAVGALCKSGDDYAYQEIAALPKPSSDDVFINSYVE